MSDSDISKSSDGLSQPDGAKHSKKRVGRGKASGQGTYAGKGRKGQKARSGGGVRPGFEGGQTPLVRRLPRTRGFRNFSRIEYQPINLVTLENRFASGARVDPESLASLGLIKNVDVAFKILGAGELEKPLKVTAPRFSRTAKSAIEAAGGSCTETAPPDKKVRNRKHLRQD